MAADPYELERFVTAQDECYRTALQELRQGRKRSHWIWFIFPQLAGLGHSATARRYAIRSRAEARAYLNHPLLGARLRQCAQAMLALDANDIDAVMDYPDNLKLKSSMTLFAAVTPAGSVFERVLDKFFAGKADEATLTLLARERNADT